MKKLAIALMFAVAVIGGAVSLPAVHDQAANADAGGWIDPLRMMINAKDLPALHYDDYSVVFN